MKGQGRIGVPSDASVRRFARLLEEGARSMDVGYGPCEETNEAGASVSVRQVPCHGAMFTDVPPNIMEETMNGR